MKNILHQYKYEKLKESSKIQPDLPPTIENELEDEQNEEIDHQSQISLGHRNKENSQNIADYGYYYENRPKTAPFNRNFAKSTLEENDQISNHASSIEGQENKNIEKREKNFKSNSDIYPTTNKHSIINQNHDLNLELNELDVDRHNLKPFRRSSQADESDIFKSFNKSDFQIPQNHIDGVEIIPIDYKGVQVNAHDLNKNSRKFMQDKKTAKRLEISEFLVERIVKSALIAGSKDNITVNCVLFNGSSL